MGKNSKSDKRAKAFNFSFARLIVFLVISAIVVGCGIAFKSQIESFLNGSQTETQSGSTDVSQIDESGLVVNFIDVGQGDAIAIKFPDDKTMLIDAGPASGKQKLIDFLDNNFFAGREKVFDYLLLTHSDSDHCGGMTEICNNYQIDKIYRPCIYYKYNNETETTSQSSAVYENTLTYYSTIKAFEAETSNIVFTSLDVCNGKERIAGSGYYFQFYSPTKTTYADVNDFSPIMILYYNGKKLMFTGDADCTSVVDGSTLPKVDLLKVAHHGSRNNSSQTFFEQVSPKVSVIQCGAGNKYHHPHQEVLNYISYVGSSVYRNDLNGNIVANVKSDDSGKLEMFVDVTVKTENATYQIKIEYLIVGSVLIVAYLCFGISFESKKKPKH